MSLTPSRHTCICCIYRPPSAPAGWRDPFLALVNFAVSEAASTIILGDFNEDLLKNTQFATDMETIFGLKQIICSPTRITSVTATLIDHIYVTGFEDVISTVDELHVSDHCAVTCMISRTTPVGNEQLHRTNTYRSMKKLDISALCADLDAIQWLDLLDSASNVNDMVSIFNTNFLKVWNKHAPLVTRRARKRKTPWLHDDVITLCNERNAAYKQFLRARTDVNHRNYKIIRNAVTDAVRRAKREFFMQGAKSGSRHFWRHIKQCTGLGKIKTLATPWPCNTINATRLSADRVNKSLIDIITQLISNNDSSKLSHSYPSPSSKVAVRQSNNFALFSLRTITSREIKYAIDAMPITASVGSDNISISMLKKSPSSTLAALAKIFNKSISSGMFLTQWKDAIVTPIYKKGNVYDPANYRQIALLSTVSKLFERLVNDQLREHLQTTKFLNDAQFGFRQGRSCELALLRLSKLLYDNRSAKQFAYLVAIDYSRAFDTVNLNSLVNRLREFTDFVTTSWFESYLNERRQATKYGNVLSDFMPTTHGVPQGSVLGPTLFSLYINPLLTMLTSNRVVAYADDLTLICPGETPSAAAAYAGGAIKIVQNFSE